MGGPKRGAAIRTCVSEYGPRDACEFVGHGNGGDVLAAARFHCERPGAEPILGMPVGIREHGTRAVDEQHAHIAVAGLADTEQALLVGRGVLALGEPEARGKAAAVGEVVRVADPGASGRWR